MQFAKSDFNMAIELLSPPRTTFMLALVFLVVNVFLPGGSPRSRCHAASCVRRPAAGRAPLRCLCGATAVLLVLMALLLTLCHCCAGIGTVISGVKAKSRDTIIVGVLQFLLTFIVVGAYTCTRVEGISVLTAHCRLHLGPGVVRHANHAVKVGAVVRTARHACSFRQCTVNAWNGVRFALRRAAPHCTAAAVDGRRGGMASAGADNTADCRRTSYTSPARQPARRSVACLHPQARTQRRNGGAQQARQSVRAAKVLHRQLQCRDRGQARRVRRGAALMHAL